MIADALTLAAAWTPTGVPPGRVSVALALQLLLTWRLAPLVGESLAERIRRRRHCPPPGAAAGTGPGHSPDPAPHKENVMSDLRQRYEEAFELWTGDTNARRALAEIAEGVHQQWQDEIRDQLGTEGEDVSVWVDRATVWVQTATEQRKRAEAAERRLAEIRREITPTKLHWMAEFFEKFDAAIATTGIQTGTDVQDDLRRWIELLDTDLDRVQAEWDYDDTQRWEHLAAADPEDM